MKCFLNGQRSIANALLQLALGSLFLAQGVAESSGLNWQTGQGYRWSELAVPQIGKTGFTLLQAETTGITFTNFITDARSVTNQNLLNGSGVALGDVDGDGDLDLYVSNYRSSTIREEVGTKFSINIVDGKPVLVKVNGKPPSSPEYAGRFAVGPHGKILEFGEADVLYLNDAKGHFT